MMKYILNEVYFAKISASHYTNALHYTNASHLTKTKPEEGSKVTIIHIFVDYFLYNLILEIIGHDYRTLVIDLFTGVDLNVTVALQ